MPEIVEGDAWRGMGGRRGADALMHDVSVYKRAGECGAAGRRRGSGVEAGGGPARGGAWIVTDMQADRRARVCALRYRQGTGQGCRSRLIWSVG